MSLETGIAVVCIVWPLAVIVGFAWLDARGELEVE
jgi:hypothetical protein